MASFAQVDWSGRPIRIEYEWVGAGDAVMVFLHEGLGSLAMWRDFPARLASALGMRGLAYSRPGYGRSTPREARERWQGDYLHRQAFEVLPALLDELGIDAPAWLFGHSDGASIALLFAARSPSRTAGVIAMAPHVFVEPVALEGIERAREAYRAGALRDRLARYHDDVDSAFWGWNDAWLAAPFREWNIEAELPAIEAPILAVQGAGDEYGTLEQVERIARRARRVEILELADCGHSPHRDQPGSVIAAAAGFVRSNTVAA